MRVYSDLLAIVVSALLMCGCSRGEEAYKPVHATSEGHTHNRQSTIGPDLTSYVENQLNQVQRTQSYDSLRLINDPLKKLLLQRLPLEWASFHPSHWLLRHRIAGDSAFQSWEWDTRMGGTMPTIYQVFLYKSKHGWKAIDPAPEPSELVLQDLLVDTIYRSLVKDDSTIILVERWKGDNLHSGLEVGLARVQGDTLCLTLPIVRGDTVTRLSFAFSEADNFVRLRTTFDERRQILYVPDSRQLPNFILYRRYQYSRRQLVPMKDTVIVSTDTFDDLVRYHRYLRERRRHYDSLTRQSN